MNSLSGSVQVESPLMNGSLTMRPKVDVLGIDVDNVSMHQAMAIVDGLINSGTGGVVNFLNAHCANISVTDDEYRKILKESDFIFGDGSGVKLSSRLMGTPFVDNVNGTDLAPLLFSMFERSQRTVAFIGGKPGVAEEAAVNVHGSFPHMIKPVAFHGYRTEEEWGDLARDLSGNPPNVAFVALGVPLQEKRIQMLRQFLPHTVFLGVGGLIDFLAERIPRAPKAFRALGMEWVWRLAQEPSRMWRRYLIGNLVFIYRVVVYSLKTMNSSRQEAK